MVEQKKTEKPSKLHQKENNEINNGTSINIKLCGPKKNVHPHAVIWNISKMVSEVQKESIEQWEGNASSYIF